MIIHHGSANIIDKPEWGKGRYYNDYGRGFYCTEDIGLAKEWACTDNYLGYVNTYGINIDKLNVLDLTQADYNVLNWLAILIMHRGTRITTPIAKSGAKWLRHNYYINVENYDVVIGYRADDSYFSFARAFLNNEISYRQLGFAYDLGDLGKQVVIKSKEAFESIKYIESERISNRIYLDKRKKRDNMARNLYIQEMEHEDLEGMYIRDMIREVDNR